jgi:23S rRNA (uridine2552-2'-O)-methyltransferase
VSYERKDAHYRRAKAAGYRARSAYKLAELDDRFRLLRAGDRVVDLGAWPGAWVQVAAERVGPSGRVVGVDLVRADPLPLPNVGLLVGDVRDPLVVAAVRAELGGPAAVVLSDLAPKLTGIRDADEARSVELAMATLDACATLLRPDGRLLVKLFMNSGYPEVMARLKGAFRQVKTTRPESTRRGSSELYAVAMGHTASCG